MCGKVKTGSANKTQEEKQLKKRKKNAGDLQEKPKCKMEFGKVVEYVLSQKERKVPNVKP